MHFVDFYFGCELFFSYIILLLGSVHILRHLPRGGGGFQKMTLDDGGRGGYGQMTSSKIAQFRDFLYLKKLLAVSVYCDNVEI